jgi:hypothetical protein
MKKYTLIIFAILMLLAVPFITQAQSTSTLPAPCQSDWPKVYLVVDNTRRHITDWATFLDLGYLTPDIVPCGEAVNDPEGAPITHLFKGASSVEVYLMETGLRRHIPDMDTFNALGFQVKNITTLPDEIVNLWPTGMPLDSVVPPPQDTVYQQIVIGSYTVRLWHPGQGITDFATLSAPDQPDVRVNDIEGIEQLPAPDVTGDGSPDLMFLTHPNGSVHCCYGTVVYNLGAVPTKILDILSPASQIPGTGRGYFQDFDGDRRYEFITRDPLVGVACTQPSVYVTLQYDPAQGQYVGATPSFASYNADMINQYLAVPLTSDPCTIYPAVTTLLYMGRPDDAKVAFDSLYQGSDAASLWTTLQTAVNQGRFYVPGN